MNRHEMYTWLKNHPTEMLAINKGEGKNYTNCSNVVLEAWITKFTTPKSAVKPLEMTRVNDATKRLVEVLANKKILIKAEVNYILGK